MIATVAMVAGARSSRGVFVRVHCIQSSCPQAGYMMSPMLFRAYRRCRRCNHMHPASMPRVTLPQPAAARLCKLHLRGPSRRTRHCKAHATPTSASYDEVLFRAEKDADSMAAIETLTEVRCAAHAADISYISFRPRHTTATLGCAVMSAAVPRSLHLRAKLTRS